MVYYSGYTDYSVRAMVVGAVSSRVLGALVTLTYARDAGVIRTGSGLREQSSAVLVDGKKYGRGAMWRWLDSGSVGESRLMREVE